MIVRNHHALEKKFRIQILQQVLSFWSHRRIKPNLRGFGIPRWRWADEWNCPSFRSSRIPWQGILRESCFFGI